MSSVTTAGNKKLPPPGGGQGKTKRVIPHASLTDMQMRFAEAYVRHGQKAKAAQEAGYSNPGPTATRLTNPDEYPLVCRYIADLREAQDKKSNLKPNDVLRYIHNVMTFNPLLFFEPGDGDGMWQISEERYKELPQEVAQLIEELQVRTVRLGKGDNAKEMKVYKVRLVSKTVAMTLAAKHQLTETSEVIHHHVNWDELAKPKQLPKAQVQALPAHTEDDEDDPVEQEIRRVQVLATKPNEEQV